MSRLGSKSSINARELRLGTLSEEDIISFAVFHNQVFCKNINPTIFGVTKPKLLLVNFTLYIRRILPLLALRQAIVQHQGSISSKQVQNIIQDTSSSISQVIS